MEIKKHKTSLPKPYGFKPFNELSDVDRQDLEYLFGSKFSQYINDKDVAIIDFHTLSRIDNVVKVSFEQGKPLNALLSIVDWTAHEFGGTNKRIVSYFIEKSEDYYILSQEKMFDLETFNLIWENFIIYSLHNQSSTEGDETKVYDKIYHHISEFVNITIKSYCFQNVRHNVKRAKGVSKKEQSDLIQKWKDLFFKTYELEKKSFFSHKANNQFKESGVHIEWSRKAMLYLVTFLSCHTRLDFHNEDIVLQQLMNDIKPLKSELVQKYDYILMKLLNLKFTPAISSFFKEFFSDIPSDIKMGFTKHFVSYDIKKDTDALMNFMPYIFDLVDLKNDVDILVGNILKTQDKDFIEKTLKEDIWQESAILSFKSVMEKNAYFSNQNSYYKKDLSDTTSYEYQKFLIEELEGFQKYKLLDAKIKQKSAEDEEMKVVKI